MGLFKPAWLGNQRDKALKAVDKVTDQSKLAEVVKNAPLEAVRLKAVQKLTDPAILADVVINAQDIHARMAAVDQLADGEALNLVEKHVNHSLLNGKIKNKQMALRAEWVRGLTDPITLADIAKNDDFYTVSEVAVERLSDQALLADVAENSKYTGLRVKAADLLSDNSLAQKLYCRIADSNEREWSNNHVQAAQKITDQQALAKVLMNRERFRWDCSDMKELMTRITDRGLISRIAKNCKSKELRKHCCEILGGHQPDGADRCKCATCGMEVHAFKETGRGSEENAGGHAQTFNIFYVCTRCGLQKAEGGYSYSDW